MSSAESPPIPRTYELVFIDSHLPQYENLRANLTTQATKGRHLEIITLHPFRDGIAQVSQALKADADLLFYGRDRDGSNVEDWVSGLNNPEGIALDFDGLDDIVSIGDPADGSLDFGTGSFSYSLYVFVPSSAGLWEMPWWKGGSSAGNPGYDMELGTKDCEALISDGTSNPQPVYGTKHYSRTSTGFHKNRVPRFKWQG